MPRPIGRPRRPVPREAVHIYLTPRLALELRELARQERRAVSSLCQIMIEDALAARRTAQSRSAS